MSKRTFLLFFWAMLYVLSSMAQPIANVTRASRLTIIDSIRLGDKRITTINNDSMLQSSDRAISTDGAIKKYIDRMVKRPVQQHPLRIRYKYDTAALTADPILLSVSSSDSIITPLTIHHASADILYAYGKPPFQVTGYFINNNPGTRLSCQVENAPEKYANPDDAAGNIKGHDLFTIYNNCSRVGYHGDTMPVTISGLYNSIAIRADLSDAAEPPYDTLVKVGITLENKTARYALDMFDNLIPPGQSITYRQQLPMFKTGPTYFRPHAQPIYPLSNGEAVSLRNFIPYRVQVYRNGALFNTLISANTGIAETVPSIEMDTSWREVKIVLEQLP